MFQICSQSSQAGARARKRLDLDGHQSKGPSPCWRGIFLFRFGRIRSVYARVLHSSASLCPEAALTIEPASKNPCNRKAPHFMSYENTQTHAPEGAGM